MGLRRDLPVGRSCLLGRFFEEILELGLVEEHLGSQAVEERLGIDEAIDRHRGRGLRQDPTLGGHVLGLVALALGQAVDAHLGLVSEDGGHEVGHLRGERA